MLHITLDQEDNNEVVSAYDREQMNKVESSTGINLELAREILAVLNEIEYPYYDVDENGNRYINWETEPISYNILRAAGESEAARLIKNKRRLDFALYGTVPVGDSERGAKLVFNNPDYTPTKAEKQLLRQWELRLFNNFFYPTNEIFANFGKFIGAAYEDFFDLDDITIEIRRDGLGNPVSVHLQDPIIYKPVIKPVRYANILNNDLTELLENYERLYDEDLSSLREEEDIPDYILVYNNKRIALANRDYVRKFHFFVRSKFQKAQRGYSIVEQALRMITYITNALKMNASNFTNSRLPLGFFAFTGGGVNATALEKLKKILWAYQTGFNNSSRFPMIALTGEKADAKWVGIRNSSREMEYHQFMTLLFSIFCQLSGTDPRELALGSYGDAVGRSRLFDEPTDGVRKESKDMGARTFLTHLADSLNSPNKYGVNIFQEITKLDVKLQFTGFEVEDKRSKLEVTTKELATTKSINELLAQEDKEKQTLMVGDVNIYDVVGIAMPQVFQSVLFKAQQQQQQQQQGAMQGLLAQQQQQQPEQEQGQEQQQGESGNVTDKDRDLLKRYAELIRGGEAEDETQQQ